MQSLINFTDRPKVYHNIDGVGELGIGVMCLGFGLLQWMQIHSPENSAWNQMYTLFAFVGVMSAGIHFGTKAIKKRLTYPRTGFVAYRKRDTLWKPLIYSFVFSVLVSGGIAIGTRSHWNLTTPVSLLGLVLAACYAYGMTRTARWKWGIAALMAIGALAIAFLPPDVVSAPAAHSWTLRLFPAPLIGAFLLNLLLYGVLCLISGGITFCSYLRHTQAAPEEA